MEVKFDHFLIFGRVTFITKIMWVFLINNMLLQIFRQGGCKILCQVPSPTGAQEWRILSWRCWNISSEGIFQVSWKKKKEPFVKFLEWSLVPHLGMAFSYYKGNRKAWTIIFVIKQNGWDLMFLVSFSRLSVIWCFYVVSRGLILILMDQLQEVLLVLQSLETTYFPLRDI
jgi:hypothetical protein